MLRIGHGDGTFAPAIDLIEDSSFALTQPVVADIDADGHLDVLVAYRNSNRISIYYGTGSGTFDPPRHEWLETSAGLSISVADLDNDGQQDLVAASLYDSLVTIVRGHHDDGVSQVTPLFAGGVSSWSSFVVNASDTGLLDAWIDFSQDGIWSEDEQIFDSVSLKPGDNLLSFSVPESLSAGATAARFRLSTAGGLLPTGSADDGEVEDYWLHIGDVMDGATGGVTLNINLSGYDTAEPLRAQLRFDGERLALTDGSQRLYDGPLQQIAQMRLTDSSQVSGLERRSDGTYRYRGEASDINVATDWAVASLVVENGEYYPRLQHDSLQVILDIPTRFQNPLNPRDVNLSGDVEPLDALLVINTFAQIGWANVTDRLSHNSDWSPKYVDVNGDGMLAPIDLLLIINELNARAGATGAAEAAGEGEASWLPQAAAPPVVPGFDSAISSRSADRFGRLPAASERGNSDRHLFAFAPAAVDAVMASESEEEVVQTDGTEHGLLDELGPRLRDDETRGCLSDDDGDRFPVGGWGVLRWGS
jgi:hypothetical protein